MTRGKHLLLTSGLAVLSSCAPAARPTATLPASRPGVEVVAALDPGRIVMGQTVYVPIHASVATADTARPINLATTLSIRNRDRSRPIVVQAIALHDSGGKPIRDCLARPVRIGPLASFDVFIAESDNEGGPSPSFLVDWAADIEIATVPFVEAMMISTAGSQGITLTSAGQVIESRHR